MNDYVITVNSTVDLPKEWLEERHIPVIPLKYTIDGENYKGMEGLSSKEFFQKLREGKMAVTSQVNPEEAKEALEAFLKEGKDILHLAFSSGLSGTYNSMRIAAEELEEEYPERKVIVIDTLCACLGEGLLLYYALKRKGEGKSIEEVAQWAEENKLHVCHNVAIDDLNHLQRGGRVSKTTAILGTMVQVKPIIHMDDKGLLQVIGKERGRKKALNKIVDMAVEQAKGWENDIIMITHGDCAEDAEYVAKLVRKKMGIENILVNNIYDLKYICVNSEADALLLENNLIKKYQPKYNILLKDDKSYPYIEYTRKPFPSLKVVRYLKVKKSKDKILFGPYVNVYAARRIVNLINRLYPLKKCEGMPKEVCLYYHIHECLGYCTKHVNSDDIINMENEIISFLRGNEDIIKNKLKEKINYYSENMNYEMALELKKELDYMNIVLEKQKVELTAKEDLDVINYAFINGFI